MKAASLIVGAFIALMATTAAYAQSPFNQSTKNLLMYNGAAAGSDKYVSLTVPAALSANYQIVFPGTAPGLNQVLQISAISGSDYSTQWVNPSQLAIPISSLTAAGAVNAIDNTTFAQTWTWTGITGNALSLNVAGTAAAASQTALNISTTGANGTAGVTTYGLQVSNTHSTNTSTNVAGYFSASSGATANYAIIVPSTGGRVGIGNAAPADLFSVGSSSQFQINNVGVITAAAGITSSGNITFSTLNVGGMVKAAAGTGQLSLGVAGSDYESGLTFNNGLTRATNTVSLGGTLGGNTTIANNNFYFAITGTGTVGIGTTTTPAAALEIGNSGSLLLSRVGASVGQIQLQGTGSGISTFQAGAQATNTFNYTLPTSVPSANDVLTVQSIGLSSPYNTVLKWQPAGAASNWSLTGNSSTTPGVGSNYLGTRSGEPGMMIVTSGFERAMFEAGDTLSLGKEGTGSTLSISAFTFGTEGWVAASTSNNQAGTDLIIRSGPGTGTGSTGDIVFEVPTTHGLLTMPQPLEEVMRITGNTGFISLGPGPFTATQPLHIINANANSSVVKIQNTSATGYSSIDFQNDGGTVGNVGVSNSASGAFPNQFYFNISQTPNKPITFNQSTVEKMAVDLNGNFYVVNKEGIGFTSSTYNNITYPLDVLVSGANTQDAFRLQNNLAAAANTGVDMLFAANRTTGGLTNFGSIAGVLTDIGNATYTGSLVLSTDSAGNGATPIERMRIGSNIVGSNLGNIVTLGVQGNGATAPPQSFTFGAAGYVNASGANNKVGTDIYIQSGPGTGAGTGGPPVGSNLNGNIIFKTPVALASSTTVQTLTEAMRITNATVGAVPSIKLTQPGSKLQFVSGDGSGGVSSFRAGSQGANKWDYILPTVAPTASQVLSASAPSGNDVTLSWATVGAGSSALSSLTAATTSHSILNVDNNQTWTWNGLTAGPAMTFASTLTAATANQKTVSITTTGANANAGITTIALDVQNTHTTNTSTNIGAQFAASGAATANTALTATVSGSTPANTAATFTASGGTSTSTGITSTVTGTATTNTAASFSASGSATNNFGLLVTNGYAGFGIALPTGNVDIAPTITAVAAATNKVHLTDPTLSGNPGSAMTNLYNSYNVPTVSLGAAGTTLSNLYNVYSGLTDSLGTITKYYGNYIAAPTGVGIVSTKYALVTESGAGNVGLSTTTPTEALEVASGNVYLSSSSAKLELKGTGSGLSSFRAGAQSGTTFDYIMPTLAPTANQVLVASVPVGNDVTLSWSSAPDISLTTLPFNKLTNATASNTTLDNTTFAQQWNWAGLAGNALSLAVTGTAAAASQTALNITTSGTNGTSLITTYGLQVGNTHAGTTSTNVAASLSASGGTSANTGLISAVSGASLTNTGATFSASGGATANNGISSTVSGASTTNTAATFTATGGTANYALIVPASSGSVGIGTSAPAALLHEVSIDATTNVTSTLEIIGHNSTGAPAANFGSAIKFQMKDATTADQDASQIATIWTDPAHATHTSALVLSTTNTSATLVEASRLAATSLMLGVQASAGNAPPSSFTFGPAGYVASSTSSNQPGADLVIQSGPGTGNSVADGFIRMRTPVAAGSSANAEAINTDVVVVAPIGAWTTNQTGVAINDLATSGTASVNKIGLNVQSTGAWSGGGTATNTGLLVTATGGSPNNYAAVFSGGGVGINTANPAGLLDVSGNLTAASSSVGKYLSLTASLLTISNNGTHATEPVNSIEQPTLAASSATTTTQAYTLNIGGAPAKGTNQTVTNTTALNIASSAVGAATASYGLQVNAQTGATSNYAAYFNGSVGINQSAPTSALDIGSGTVKIEPFSTNGIVVNSSTGVLSSVGLGSSGQVLTSTGSGSDPSFQDLPVIAKVKTTSESYGSVATGTNFHDDANIAGIPIGANEVWSFEGMLIVESANATPDIKWHWVNSVTNGFASIDYAITMVNQGAATFINNSLFSTNGTTTNSTTETAPLTAGVNQFIYFHGSFVWGGTAGTLKLQWAQNNANVNVINVLRGSYMNFTKHR